MRFLKADIAIWNINSFAEFYMQIAEKYKSDYKKALSLFRTERERFFSALNKIKNIKVFSSQANYFMCELFGISSKELTDILIEKHNILIKDLSAKFNGGASTLWKAVDMATKDFLSAGINCIEYKNSY